MIHLVDIEQRSQSQNATTGEITETWAVVHSRIFCDIKPLSVRDFIAARAEQSEVSVRIVLPFLPGLNPAMRIVGKCGCHLGRIYNPAGFLEDQDTGQEYITAPCSEGVNVG